MKNKKLNELKNEPPSLEEQQAFINDLVARSKQRQADLVAWMESFKKDHRVVDEIR